MNIQPKSGSFGKVPSGIASTTKNKAVNLPQELHPSGALKSGTFGTPNAKNAAIVKKVGKPNNNFGQVMIPKK